MTAGKTSEPRQNGLKGGGGRSVKTRMSADITGIASYSSRSARGQCERWQVGCGALAEREQYRRVVLLSLRERSVLAMASRLWSPRGARAVHSCPRKRGTWHPMTLSNKRQPWRVTSYLQTCCKRMLVLLQMGIAAGCGGVGNSRTTPLQADGRRGPPRDRESSRSALSQF